jgi:predicted alpha/beta superfamily hydrolase
MKNITFIAALVSSVIMYSQSSVKKYIESYELSETRELRVFLPASYEQDSIRYYPLTVVFDGEYLFDVVAGNSVLFSQKNKAPEQIIVGISQGNNKRYQDCAYNQGTSYPDGKSEAFYRFVRSELLSFMEQNYRISPFKTIVGSTLTANFANYFILEDSPGFDAFIVINPYLAPDMSILLSNNVAHIKNNIYYYYMSSGDYNSEKRHTAIKTVDSELSHKKNPRFNYKYQEFNGGTSTSSIGQSVSSALAFIFEIYSSISKKEFKENIKDLSPPDAIAYLENKYVEIDYLFGSNLKIRESDIYAIEPIIIDKENGEYLRDFGEMIYKLFPESPLGDYYVGLDFEFRGKFKEALKAYKVGYMKFKNDPVGAESFYKNIERVVDK